MSSNTSSLLDQPAPAISSQLAAEIRAACAPLRVLVSGLRPADVPLCWAPEVLSAFLEVQRVAESGRVLMTARAAEAGEWERRRFPSPADWLADQQGTTTGRARAELELSGQLGGLDATADAVRAGLLSPEQAGAVADAASVNPAAEADLLDRAGKDSLRRTKQEAERRKAEVRSEEEKAERERRVRAERDVRFWYSNGAGNMTVRGPVADLKELEQRIQREVDKAFRANRAPAQRGTRGNYAFDALMTMGQAGCGAGGAEGSRVRRAPLTRMTLVRVDLGALVRGSVQAGEICEIGGIAVSVAELRRTLGESIMQLVLTNGEAVIDVVNLSRKPTVAQMVATLFTDATCTVQGCDRAARLEFDHRDDWARVLVTELDNIDLLCDHHHDEKTYNGCQLIAGTGRRPMVPPDDPRHPHHAGRASPPAAPAGSSGGAPGTPPNRPRGAPVSSEITARIARIKRKEAEFQARLAGQDPLFDTG